ncbi:hypothetical protein [Xanthomonas vesicatoria]|uniref:hypothetical protein n=1 Tax=Xanthomonas vesicatoria TaxID=56460 RepID=UPI001E626190|nr:hypothetical protein [Xanthomonas vesicatoria]MCC8620062.1 hypothetical protein [Xanthomonas vesicatoria]MCC8632435.1 hypothetical protein [Xanthomonas vesicatoria]
MDRERQKYYDLELAALDKRASLHSVALNHMTGSNINVNGKILTPTILVEGEEVDRKDFAHLFWLFNGASGLYEKTLEEGGDGAPPGIYIRSHGQFVDADHFIRVGIFKRRSMFCLNINSLFIDHVFLDETRSPPQMGTIGFILCAFAAYKRGLHSIRLLAAGGTDPRYPSTPYGADYRGYYVWPKFGFDAPLYLHERFDRRLWRCRTVQDARLIDEELWRRRGYQRFMTFDLSPGSTSWKMLLEYAKTRV